MRNVHIRFSVKVVMYSTLHFKSGTYTVKLVRKLYEVELTLYKAVRTV